MNLFGRSVGNVLSVDTLGDVQSDKFVGVFYSPFLPECIRVDKEYDYTFEDLEQIGMAGELKAVVSGDGEYMLSVREHLQLWTDKEIDPGKVVANPLFFRICNAEVENISVCNAKTDNCGCHIVAAA